MRFEKIINYSVKIGPSEKLYLLKLKLINSEEEPYEVKFSSACELAAVTELLRDEANTFFDTETNEILIGWEPTGENDPKHERYK
jgi:hypothetical protein